jgi:hypothetical protein
VQTATVNTSPNSKPLQQQPSKINFHEQKRQVKDIKDTVDHTLEEDDYIATPVVPDVSMFIDTRNGAEDTGAGLFGALRHVDTSAIEEIKARRKMYEDLNSDDDDNFLLEEDDAIPKWKVNRKVLNTELENTLKKMPFESYTLTRGKLAHGPLGHSTFKQVGIFKGLVRISYNKSENFFGTDLIDELTKPKGYKVRLYVLESFGLERMDVDISGAKQASDPYLKVHKSLITICLFDLFLFCFDLHVILCKF